MVWRPVEAEHLPDGSYLIVGEVPEEEQWEFQPGERVAVRRHVFSTELVEWWRTGKWTESLLPRLYRVFLNLYSRPTETAVLISIWRFFGPQLIA